MGLPVEPVQESQSGPGGRLRRREWREWLQEHRVEFNAMVYAELLLAWLDREDGTVRWQAYPTADCTGRRLVADVRRLIRQTLVAEAIRAARVDEQTEATITRLQPQIERAEMRLLPTVERELTTKLVRHWSAPVSDVAEKLAAIGRRRRKEMTFTLPRSFDSAGFLPRHILLCADDARWLVSTILRKMANRDTDPWGWTRLHSTILRRVMGNHTCDIIRALEQGAIEPRRTMRASSAWATRTPKDPAATAGRDPLDSTPVPPFSVCQLSGFPGGLTTVWQVFRPRRGPGAWPHSPKSTERLLFRAGFGTSVVGTRTVWPFRRYRSGAVVASRRRMRGNRRAKEQRWPPRLAQVASKRNRIAW